MNIKSTNIEMERYTISQLLQKLFQELEQQKIKWCSWKSNEHIYPALIGDTDLDALFQTNDRSKVIEIMQQCGFVLFKPTAHRAYPGVLDFIATDPISGKILHVHAHFLLTLGEQHLKSYIFPWNDIILKYRIRHDEFQDTYISNYEMEIAFLLIRYSIKMRWREQIKYSIKSKFGDHDFWAEFQWLQRRVTLQKLNVFLPQILNESMTSSLLNIIDEGPNVCNMAKLREEVESTSKKNHWRRFSSAHVPFLMWKNEVKNNLVRLFDKMSFSQTIIKRRRALHGHGFVVSFMGADGSGKSTITKNIIKAWEHKIDLPYVYLGSGDGQKGLLTVLLKGSVCIKNNLIKKQLKTLPISAAEGKYNNDLSLSLVVTAIVGCIEKRRLLRKVRSLRAQGFIIICDRWPQNQVHGINDGPLLQKETKNFFFQKISNWEQDQFDKMLEIIHPDLVIKLTTSLETAINRKPENAKIKDVIALKIDVVKNINFNSTTIVKEINTESSIKDTIQQTQRLIWDALTESKKYKVKNYECFGLPGSGKTTISNNIDSTGSVTSLEKLFQENALKTMEKVLFILKSVPLRFSMYLCILLLILKYPQLWNIQSILYLLKIPMQHLRLHELTKDSETTLSEQYFLQNIWSACLTISDKKLKKNDTSRLIGKLYKYSQSRILYFSVPNDVAIERIKNRGGTSSRFDHLTEEKLTVQMEKASKIMDIIISSAKDTGLDIVYIDSNKKIKDITLDVQEVLS